MPSTNKIIDLSALSHFKAKLDLILVNKADTSSIPTAVSDLTNDLDFQTGTEVATAIDEALAGITGIDFEIVQTLPQTGEKGVIYLVPNSGGSGSDIYDEYIWITNSGVGSFEKIGSTDIDLSGYVQFTDILYATNAEIDALFT